MELVCAVVDVDSAGSLVKRKDGLEPCSFSPVFLGSSPSPCPGPISNALIQRVDCKSKLGIKRFELIENRQIVTTNLRPQVYLHVVTLDLESIRSSPKFAQDIFCKDHQCYQPIVGLTAALGLAKGAGEGVW